MQMGYGVNCHHHSWTFERAPSYFRLIIDEIIKKQYFLFMAPPSLFFLHCARFTLWLGHVMGDLHMVKPSKWHKQLQLSLHNVQAARWPSGLTPVTPTGSSAPSPTPTTPPESLTLSSFELAESDGQDQHVYSLSNSPLHQEGPVSPNHSTEPEGADEGYRSDDLMSEIDSDDCMNSLERQMEWEVGFLESEGMQSSLTPLEF